MKRILTLLFGIIFITMNAQQKVIKEETLTIQQKSLARISALTASGNLEALRTALTNGLDSGLTINEIKEALVQLYAYCGFPRSLNGINTFKSVLDSRKANGIKDTEGKKIIETNNLPDKYEQGRKTLEVLSQTPQQKPAPGFGEFAPRIDAFLKEHLFADIFASDVLSYQQRELVTISALAAMPGVVPQLQSHIGMGKNTGITDNQLSLLADIIEQAVSVTQANTIREILKQPVAPLVSNGLIVRISELEIVPEHLSAYRALLNEEAETSMKKESGVVAIFPMNQQENPTLFRIVEIYNNKSAYDSHLQTSHFQKYKKETVHMVKNLKLVDMDAVDKETMALIFQKLK